MRPNHPSITVSMLLLAVSYSCAAAGAAHANTQSTTQATDRSASGLTVGRVLEIPASWDRQELMDVMSRGVERLARKHLPKYGLDQRPGYRSIRLQWRTQRYDVPRPTSKTGDDFETRRETGPSTDGLILDFWVSENIGQLRRPTTRDNAGLWKTYCGQLCLPSLNTYLMFNLDYGPRTDKELIRVFSNPRLWLEQATPQPATQPADLSVPRLSWHREEKLVVEALSSRPVDEKLLRDAIRPAVQVCVSYRTEGERAFVTGGVPTTQADPKARTVRLVRDQAGDVPQQWIDILTAPLQERPEVLVRLLLGVPEELRDDRDTLLARADEHLRAGLLELAEEFPFMKKARDWHEISQAQTQSSAHGRLSLRLAHTSGGKAKTSATPVPESERFSILALLRHPEKTVGALSTHEILPCLGLEGYCAAGAGNTYLNARLKKLLAESLEPLQELDDRAARIIASRLPAAKATASAQTRRLTQMTQEILRLELLGLRVGLPSRQPKGPSAERLANPDDLEYVLESTDRSANVGLRRKATPLLLEWADQQKVRARLVELATVTDTDWIVRLRAMQVLVVLGQPVDVDFLRRIASGEIILSSSEFERNEAALALLAMGEKLPPPINSHSINYASVLKTICNLQQSDKELTPDVFSELVEWRHRLQAPVAQPAGAWSKVVNGLAARIVLARSHVVNGTPIISTRLDLRNTSNAALRVSADRKLTFRVVDPAGRERPRTMGPYSGSMPYPKDLLLPPGAELSEDLTRAGLGIGPDQAGLIDLGAEDNWTIPHDDKEYFLHVVLEVLHATGGDDPGTQTWHGRLELPPARIPLKPEPMDPSTIAQRIDELGRTMISSPGEAGSRAIRALSLIEDERVVPWYVKAVQTNRYDLKFAALDRLSRFNSDEAFLGLKMGLATRGADFVSGSTALADNIRHSTAQALSRSPHPEAKRLLLSLWNDPDRAVRMTVLHALGRMDSAESLRLLKKMSKDTDKDVRKEALRYLKLRPSSSEGTAAASSPETWLEGLLSLAATQSTSLSPEMTRRRDALLTQADAEIRRGLLRLAEDYPQLKERRRWDNIGRPSKPGKVSIWLFHTDQEGKPRGATANQPAQRPLAFCVSLAKPPTEHPQRGGTMYPHLGLFGEVEIAPTGDPQLDSALKKLVADALAPLAKLEKQAAILATQPAAATQPPTQPTAATPPLADIQRLIKQLDSEELVERENAQRALVRIGRPTMAALRSAMADGGAERAHRAKRALKQIATPEALLSADIDKFRLCFWQRGASGDMCVNLSLNVPAGTHDLDICPFGGGNEVRTAIRISQEQAGRIIDHLAAEGFMEEVRNLYVRLREPAGFPGTTVTLFGPMGVEYVNEIQWSLPMLDRLEALRKVLDGEAADAMDAFLAPLRAHREEWQKQAATQPAVAQPAVATRDGETSYRQLFAKYRTMVFETASDGDRNEVARLTGRLKESLGNRLLYAFVVRTDAAGKRDVLMNKVFVRDYIPPAFELLATEDIQMSWGQDSVVVLQNIDAGHLLIRLDVRYSFLALSAAAAGMDPRWPG